MWGEMGAAPGGEDEDREGERECVCDRERQENLESTQILKGRNSQKEVEDELEGERLNRCVL